MVAPAAEMSSNCPDQSPIRYEPRSHSVRRTRRIDALTVGQHALNGDRITVTASMLCEYELPGPSVSFGKLLGACRDGAFGETSAASNDNDVSARKKRGAPVTDAPDILFGSCVATTPIEPRSIPERDQYGQMYRPQR
jgi:hypothetical protein